MNITSFSSKSSYCSKGAPQKSKPELCPYVRYDRLPFNKLLSMGSYDFVSANKFEKMVGPFLAPYFRIWLFSGLDFGTSGKKYI